jgi:DUF438 domain-containing protein
MLKLALDENLYGEIYDRLRTMLPQLDVIRIQDTSILSADDETMLEWVALQGRLLVTHDKRTITDIYYNRLKDGKPAPAVFMVVDDTKRKAVAEDLAMIVQITSYSEWADKITYLPL